MDEVIDKNKVFKVFAGSADISPFHECYANDRTILRNCAGRLFPHYNGEDIVSCYWALREKAVLFDVPERPIEVSGTDAVSFLNKIFTRDISALKIGRGQYTLSCTFDGGLFMDVIVFRLSFSRFWIVQPDGNLRTWLEAHKFKFDVKIIDPRSRVLQIQGPKSFKIINQASNGSIDSNFGYFHVGLTSLGNQEVLVSRTGWTGEFGYEVYTQGDKTNAVQLWQLLIQSGKEEGLKFGSMQAMNIRRIEAGILDSGSDFDQNVSPFEAGLERFVDLGKDYFIGKTALLEMSRKKKIFGVICNSHTPSRGDFIICGKRKIGTVTTGALSPQLNSGIGYVKLFESGNFISELLVLKTLEGEKFQCEIVELPFYDKNKLIPRTF